MADFTVATSKHATLTGTTIDKVTLTGDVRDVEVVNRTGTANMWVRTDQTDPVASADNAIFIPPGGAVLVRPISREVRLLGDGNNYSVQAVAT